MFGIFKGIGALFKSGIFFRPYVLTGVFIGFAMISNTKNDADLYKLIKSELPYLAVFGVSIIFAFFSKATREYGKFNLSGYFSSLLGYTVGGIFSLFCAIAFYYVVLSSGDPTPSGTSQEDVEMKQMMEQINSDLGAIK